MKEIIVILGYNSNDFTHSTRSPRRNEIGIHTELYSFFIEPRGNIRIWNRKEANYTWVHSAGYLIVYLLRQSIDIMDWVRQDLALDAKEFEESSVVGDDSQE